jgi:hypothetical protein
MQTSPVFDALAAGIPGESIAAPIVADVKRKLRNRQPAILDQLFRLDRFYQ